MVFDEFANDVALERQIRLVISTLENVTEGYDYYHFRCHICGDSQKSKSKKRGYILKKKKPWMYFCHNCFYKRPVTAWLKEFFPAYYKDYFRELLQSKDKKQKPLPKVKNPKIRKRSPEKEHTKHFVPIMKGSGQLFDSSISLCKKRNIPESVWSKWFVATGGMYRNRLVLPFFDNKNKIYNYQCRALYENMSPKYLTRIGDNNCIYNYYLVDKEKPVICFEGIIDSLMVPNSIAICGANKEVDLSKFSRIFYLLDNDKTGKQRSINLLTRGGYVFLWNKFILDNKFPKCKDLNEMCVKINKPQFTFEELQKYFSNSIFDKVFLI